MQSIGLVVGAAVVLWASVSVGWRLWRSVRRWFSANTGLFSRMKATGSFKGAVGELIDAIAGGSTVVEGDEGDEVDDDESLFETTDHSDASNDGSHHDDSH